MSCIDDVFVTSKCFAKTKTARWKFNEFLITALRKGFTPTVERWGRKKFTRCFLCHSTNLFNIRFSLDRTTRLSLNWHVTLRKSMTHCETQFSHYVDSGIEQIKSESVECFKLISVNEKPLLTRNRKRKTIPFRQFNKRCWFVSISLSNYCSAPQIYWELSVESSFKTR